MEKKVSRVILNGETIMDIHEDSVNQDNLLQDETAHGSDGEPIIGRASIGGDYYSPNDPASTDLANDDYIPFNDVSDSETPKKKTLFSNIIDKLKQIFLSKSANSQVIEGRVLALKDNGIDASKTDNDVSEITYPTMFCIQDKDGRNIVNVEAVVNPDGRIGFNSYVRNYDTNGDGVAQKGILYYMDKSGALQYNVGDGEAFISAVGFGYAVGSVSGTTITANINGFVLTKGGIVVLNLSAVMPENAKLNVNNTGAKDIIWYSNNGIRERDLPHVNSALWTLAYDGTYWRIISVNKTPEINQNQYVADTSGDIRLSVGYDQNQFDLRYDLAEDKLFWNRYINGAWHGNVEVIDAEHSYLQLGTYVPENVDLNDYTSEGSYHISANATAQTLSNIPVQLAGKLVVMKVRNNSNFIQLFYPYAGDHTFYFRATDNNGSSWTAWREFGTTDAIYDIANVYNTKNLLPLKGDTWTSNGLTFTCQSDGSIKVNGTATADTTYVIRSYLQNGVVANDYDDLVGKSFILSGCPSGGSNTTYKLFFYRYNGTNDAIDYGSGTSAFTVTRTTTGYVNIAITIRNGITVSNLLFYPMLRLSSIKDSSFVPFAPTNKQLLDAYNKADNIIETNQYLSTKVTSLDDIPLNTAGRIYLDATIDPLGVDREYVYICYGRSPFKTIELTRVVHTNKNTEEFWKNSNNGSDGWTGWLPLSRTGTYVGTCTTYADQQIKQATVDADFSLKKGVRIAIKFSHSNEYTSTTEAPVKLNVNGTGAKQIYYNATATPSGINRNAFGVAGRYIFYIYDGNYWVWDGQGREDDTTYPVITVEQIGAGSDTESRVVRADYLRSGIRYVMGSLDMVRLSYMRVKSVGIPDNSGWPKYLLLKDITTWYNSTEDEQLTQGYTGLIFDSRQGNGYTRKGITDVSAMVAYHKVTSVDNSALLLNSSNANTFIPVIMKDSSNKYYLALKTLGAGRLMTFLGRWIHDGNANTDWDGYNGTWISCTDSSGTLPTGYSVVISNDSKMYDNTFLADADNKAFGIAFCASNSSSGAAAITATSNRYVLKQGGFVTVYFQYAVPADATLNINGRGARNIIYAGANIKNNVIFAGDRATFIYDGTNYVLVTIDRAITGRTLMGTCTTAADQRNKVGTVDGDFVLRKGVRVGLKFSNTNTFSSQTSTPITLNVNSTGAKNIFYNQTHSGAGNTGTNSVAYGVSSRINYYVYDGTYWVWDGSSYDNNSDCRKAFYGTCSTEAATEAKVVTLSDTTGWELRAGTIVGVKFTNSNTASNVTLNVNNTGAKSIYYNNAVYTGSSNGVCGYANRTSFYMYNGSQWVFLAQGVTNSDTYTSAYCSTAGGTAAKAATCSGYALASKSHLHIIMTAANTVKGAITLNVNGKGAKPIYINGSASSASNYTLPAGSYLIYYNGTNYYFRTDGKITCAGTVTV